MSEHVTDYDLVRIERALADPSSSTLPDVETQLRALVAEVRRLRQEVADKVAVIKNCALEFSRHERELERLSETRRIPADRRAEQNEGAEVGAPAPERIRPSDGQTGNLMAESLTRPEPFMDIAGIAPDFTEKQIAMSETKHTPGPWRTASYDNGLTWKVETAEGRRAVASYVAGLRGECEANARLISAAPTMLTTIRRQLAAQIAAGTHEKACPWCQSGKGCDWSGWNELEDSIEAMRSVILQAESPR